MNILKDQLIIQIHDVMSYQVRNQIWHRVKNQVEDLVIDPISIELNKKKIIEKYIPQITNNYFLPI